VLIERHVAAGDHRGIIGGLWEELGSLQLEFLKSDGLQPRHTLIDIGAGSFRAGVKLAAYLDPGNYYAVDLQASLLEAGYAREIEPLGLAGRFPRNNFATSGNFDISGFRKIFEFGIAQSVFTHMPVSRLNDCLATIAPHFSGSGKFFATVFLAPEEASDRSYEQSRGGIVTAPDHDPFHTTLSALKRIADLAPEWRMTVIGEWGHPRNQKMVCFVRRGR
jgi:hypothetical protein